MEKIVVDSNIIFSSFLKKNSRISQILINGYKYYDFYSPQYVRTEILNHKEKIKAIAKLSENDFFEIYELLLKKVRIINHSLIPVNIFNLAYDLCFDIDQDDTSFIAAGIFLKAKIWTGDKELIRGLIKKGYNQFITSDELYSDFIDKIDKQRKKK
jgi:predicted nucleic acid-binding protein